MQSLDGPPRRFRPPRLGLGENSLTKSITYGRILPRIKQEKGAGQSSLPQGKAGASVEVCVMEDIVVVGEEAAPPALEELVELKAEAPKEKKAKAPKKKVNAEPKKEAEKTSPAKKGKASRLVKSAGQTPATIYNRLSHFPGTGRRAQLFRLLNLTPVLVTVAGVTYPGPFQAQTAKVQEKLTEFLAAPTEENKLFYNA